MDTDNSVVIARGRGDYREWEEGRGGLNGDVGRPDLGW